MSLTFEQIDINAAQRLSTLAKKAYLDHYMHLWKDNNPEWYINRSFNIEPLSTELVDSDNHFYIISEDGVDLGFLKLVQKHPLSISDVKDENSLYLERIYFIKQAVGRGVGEKTMHFAFQKAAEWRYNSVWLSAMDTSTKPIAFYERMGFVICGRQQLDFTQIKDEMRGMVVMRKQL